MDEERKAKTNSRAEGCSFWSGDVRAHARVGAHYGEGRSVGGDDGLGTGDGVAGSSRHC